MKSPASTVQQNKSKAVAAASSDKQEKPVQQKNAPVQRKANQTGLPDNLKSGVENLSGISMDDVKVHYNSPKPAQLQAHAYAQGTDIHVASGQEKHVPHEAWHVVQQKQGRVQATTQMKGKINVNDNAGLEKEADLMGAKALSGTHQLKELKNPPVTGTVQLMGVKAAPSAKKMLGKEEQEKLNKLIGVMQSVLSGIPGMLSIEITNEAEMTPAWNHHKGSTHYPGKDGDIGVELNKWYLEKASVGDLFGMFIHEIGVHTLADKKMGATHQGTQTQNGTEFHNEFLNQGNNHVNQIGGTIGAYPNAAESATGIFKRLKGRSRQRDHVNLAKSLAGGNSTRSQHYIKLYLDTGDAIDNSKTFKGAEKNNALRDLTQSFLFDIARLVATDDGGAVSLFWNADRIGQLMNYYRTNILNPQIKKHPWLANASAGIQTNKWNIRGWLAGKLATLSVSSNPGVQVARSGLLGMGAAYLAGGTVAAALTLPAWGGAALVGAAVGGTAYLAQKYFGV